MGLDHTIPINISIALEGDNRPNPAGMQIGVIIRFFAPGANVLLDTPIYEFPTMTTVVGDAVSCTIYGVPFGTYDISIVSNHTLLNVKRKVYSFQPEVIQWILGHWPRAMQTMTLLLIWRMLFNYPMHG